MATLCKLCNEKIGFLDAGYSVAGLTICENCYFAYIKVLDSIYDVDNFVEALTKFQDTFSGHENLEKIVQHLNDLHEAALLNPEKERISESKNINEKVEKSEETIVDDKDLLKATASINSEKVTSNSSERSSNISKQIKALAIVVAVVGIVASLIGGFVLITTSKDLILAGYMLALFGPLISWVSFLVLFGFGHLIKNTDKLVELLKNQTKTDNTF